MSFLGVLGEVGASIVTGGVTGLLGTGLSIFKDISMKKLQLQEIKMKFDNALELRKVDNEMMKYEIEGKTRITQIETTGAIAVEEQKAFAKSYEDENKHYSEKVKPTGAIAFVLVAIDFIRAVIRPGMAIGLFVLTCLLYNEMHKIAGGWKLLSPDQAFDLVLQIVTTILYLFTTCVTWYYGVRNSQSAPSLSRSK